MYISKKNLIIMGVILFTLLSVSTYFAFSKYSFISTINQKESNNKNEEIKVEIIKEQTDEKEIKKEEESKTIEKFETKTEDSSNNNKTVSSNTNINTSTNSNTNTSDNKTDIVSYLNNLDNTVFKEENIRNYSSKAKETFVKITDFIFYGTTMNGVTFNELKDEVKLKVMNIVLKIDSKIEKIHPGYKDEMKLKVTNLKEKIAIKYLEVSSKICDSLGEDSCNEAKKGFQNMKDSFGVTFDILKVIGKDGLNSIKGWYEIFRES